MENLSITQTQIEPSSNEAFLKGYDDYQKSVKSDIETIFNRAYNPPHGQEKSYKEGWEQAEREKSESEALFWFNLT